MKRRLAHSFLISLNLHVWALVLMGLVWVASKKEPIVPEHLQVQILRLPAPVVGEVPEVTDAVSTANEDLSNNKRAHARHSCEPVVEYRVRVSEPLPSSGANESFAPPVTLAASAEMYVPRDTAVFSAPTVKPSDDQVIHEIEGHRLEVGQFPNPDRDKDTDRGTAIPDLEYGGDTRPLIEIIQARIDAVTPLVHRTSETYCRFESGVVRIKFIINREGYPCGYRIISASGSECLHKEVDNVLHLAEPYPYVAGWIPVTLKFTL